MKVLVLVIVSFDKPVYYDMLAVWKKRINEMSITDGCMTDGRMTDGCITDGRMTDGCMTDGCMTDVWFIQNKSDKEWVGDIVNDLRDEHSQKSHSLKDRFELDIANKTLYVKGDECLIPGILHKTVEAITFFLGTEGYYTKVSQPVPHFSMGSKGNDEFPLFVWRTNLSSVLDFAGLEKYLSIISSTKALYAGYVGLGSLNNGSSSFFASGAGFLLSRDVAEYLIENKDFLRWDLIDDVAIGALLEPKYGIVPLDRCWVQTTDENIQDRVSSGIFHFRCESYQHLRTVEFMRYVDEALAKK